MQFDEVALFYEGLLTDAEKLEAALEMVMLAASCSFFSFSRYGKRGPGG